MAWPEKGGKAEKKTQPQKNPPQQQNGGEKEKQSPTAQGWEGWGVLCSGRDGAGGPGLRDLAGAHGPGARMVRASHLQNQQPLASSSGVMETRGGAAPPSSSFSVKLDRLKDKTYSGVSSRRHSPGQQPAERLGGEMLPTSPAMGNGGFCGAAPPAPRGPGSVPHAARLPRCRCQAPTNGPRRPASSHFCAQGPLSPARERNVPMSDTRTGGHLCSGGRARTSDPSIPPSHPCDDFPH